jgi:hypothetical protein
VSAKPEGRCARTDLRGCILAGGGQLRVSHLLLGRSASCLAAGGSALEELPELWFLVPLLRALRRINRRWTSRQSCAHCRRVQWCFERRRGEHRRMFWLLGQILKGNGLLPVN